jgi:ABC-2 type transport system permease protein
MSGNRLLRPLARLRLPRRRPGLPTGIAAIMVKDLRGRMRGRRTYIVLTVYLVLLGGFAWMLLQINEQTLVAQSCQDFSSCGGFRGGGDALGSASIGRGIFVGLMMLLTLITAVLSPASTAGAISGERERQTLDLLTVTPITSVAIVLGKLLSALAWVFLLIFASIPLTALVFAFGGVAPDDILRGYGVLLATAVGFGSVGLFFSGLLQRTGAATGLTYVMTLLLTIGSAFYWVFLGATSNDGFGTRRPAEVVLYLNPFVAQADVACGTEIGFSGWCSIVGSITGDVPTFGGGVIDGQVKCAPDGSCQTFGSGVAVPVGPAFNGGVCAAPDCSSDIALASGASRDRLWPRIVASYLALSALLTFLSVRLVGRTSGWRQLLRPRRPGRRAVAADA